MREMNSIPVNEFVNEADVLSMVAASPIFLYVYEVDDEGHIVDFETSNTQIPRDDCLTFKTDMKVSLQVDRVKVSKEFPPKLIIPDDLKDFKVDRYGVDLK